MRSATRLVAVFGAALSAAAAAQIQLNTISKVEVSGGTITIVGSKKPNFTTFTMTDPARLVIDIAEAVFSGVPEEQKIGNGTVTAIRIASYGSDASAIARVLIGFTKEVETDIQASDTKLVVKVLGAGAPGPAVATAEKPADKAAADKAAADKAAADKATAGKAAADKAVADKAATDKAAADKAVAEKAKADAEAAKKAEADEKKRVAEESKLAAEAAKKSKAEEAAAAKQAAADEKKAKAEAAAAEKKAKADEAAAAKQAAADEKKAKAEAAAADKKAKADEAATSKQAAGDEKKTKAEEAAAAKQAAADEKKAKAEEAAAAKQAAADEKKAKAEEAAAAKQAAADEKKAKAEEAAAAKQAAADQKKAKPEQVAAATPPPPPPEEKKAAAAQPPPPGEISISNRRKTMTFVGFKQDTGMQRVYVRTNEPVKYTVQKAGDRRVVLELENTGIAETNNTRFLDTSYFNGAVAMVQPHVGETRTVRVEISLKENVPYEAQQQGNEVFVNFQTGKK